MPAWRIALVHFTVSARTKAAASSGVEERTVMPRPEARRERTSSDAAAATTA